MERVQSEGYVTDVYVFRRNLLQPAARQMGRVQSDGYGSYVYWRNLLQPVAQQVERVQCEVCVGYVEIMSCW